MSTSDTRPDNPVITRRPPIVKLLRPVRVPALVWLVIFAVTGYIVATANNVTNGQALFILIAVYALGGAVILLMRWMYRWYPEEAAAGRERAKQARQMSSLAAIWFILGSRRVPLVYFIYMVAGLIYAFLTVRYPWLP